MDVATGRKVHDGVGAPPGRPHHLVDLLGDGARHRRIANVGIDFHRERLADDHRLALRVVVVGRDHRAAVGHFVTHQFGGHGFTRGDERHLRGDLAGPRPLQLRAPVANDTGPRGQAGMQIDRRMRVGVRAGRVVEVEVLTVGQVHPAERHPRVPHPFEVPVVLTAALDRAGGHRRIDKKINHFISLRRHYPVRFVRSTAPAVLSAHWVCAPVCGQYAG